MQNATVKKSSWIRIMLKYVVLTDYIQNLLAFKGAQARKKQTLGHVNISEEEWIPIFEGNSECCICLGTEQPFSFLHFIVFTTSHPCFCFTHHSLKQENKQKKISEGLT